MRISVRLLASLSGRTTDFQPFFKQHGRYVHDVPTPHLSVLGVSHYFGRNCYS